MKEVERLATFFREARGEVTQADLARELRCTQSYLSKIEGGTTIPSPAFVKRFAKHLGKPEAVDLWRKAKKAEASAAIEESAEEAL